MADSKLDPRLDELWTRRAELSSTDAAAREIVTAAVDAPRRGGGQGCRPDPVTGEIIVDERAKQAILLAFRLLPMEQTLARFGSTTGSR